MAACLGSQGSTPADHTRIGLLLCNLGTPAAPTPRAVRRYLAEFLSDPRVVELPRIWWWPILHGVVLNLRPRRSAEAYRKIWTAEGSPLLAISQRQARALHTRLTPSLGDAMVTALAMRYGAPSVADGLEYLRRSGVGRLLVLPLYPQYSASTTASTFDAVADTLKTWRRVPELRFIAGYHTDGDYIAALATSVRNHWTAHGRGARLLVSFHGLPRAYCEAGDPYRQQCETTARLLADALELAAAEWRLSFQSRIGPKKWIEPYTDETLGAWGAEGLGRVDVICPGFAADCLETLEEIQIRNRERFIAAGGDDLRYIPALNDSAAHIDALARLVLRHIDDWRPV